MATKYLRVKGWWGDAELYYSDEAPYSPAQSKALGTNAAPPGIGVRRCQLVFARAPTGSVEDVATTHMDFLNLTGGEPDDTWVDADFLALEAAMSTWWGQIRGGTHTSCKLSEYRWYRIGPAVVPPNPPVRIAAGPLTLGVDSSALPPQVAMTVTFRPPVRRQWGRIYLPSPGGSKVDGTTGRILNAWITTVANATDALHGTAAAADFIPVVYSKARGKAFGIEQIQVDDLFDVVRRRRWDRPLIRTIKS